MNATLHKLIRVVNRYGRAETCEDARRWLKSFPESATLQDVLIALPYIDRDWLSIILEALTQSSSGGGLIWMDWCSNGGRFADSINELLRQHHYSKSAVYLHQRDYRWLEWKLRLWETEGQIIEQLLREAKV